MKMYFATTANGRSETKAIGDTYFSVFLRRNILRATKFLNVQGLNC